MKLCPSKSARKEFNSIKIDENDQKCILIRMILEIGDPQSELKHSEIAKEIQLFLLKKGSKRRVPPRSSYKRHSAKSSFLEEISRFGGILGSDPKVHPRSRIKKVIQKSKSASESVKKVPPKNQKSASESL